MLHVKLFSVASPIPLPEWFQKWSDCCLRKKSMLENFPGHIRNFVGVKKLPDDILSELELIQYKKPVDKPKYSVNMLRYALLLRYTSVQAYLLVIAVSFTFIKPSEETYWRCNWAIQSSQSFTGKRKNWQWCGLVAWWGLFTKRFTISRWETCWYWQRRKFVRKCYDIHDKQLKEVYLLFHKSYTWNKNRRKIAFRTHW